MASRATASATAKPPKSPLASGDVQGDVGATGTGDGQAAGDPDSDSDSDLTCSDSSCSIISALGQTRPPAPAALAADSVTDDADAQAANRDADADINAAIARCIHNRSSASLHSHRLPAFRFVDRDSLAGLGRNQPPSRAPSLPGHSVSLPNRPAGIDSTPGRPVGTAHQDGRNPTKVPEIISSPQGARPVAATATATAASAAPILLPPHPSSPANASVRLHSVSESHPATNHHNTSADSPQSNSASSGHSTRSRASSYETASTSAPVTPPATAQFSRSAPIVTNTTPVDNSPPASPRSQSGADSSPPYWTPVTRPRTRDTSSPKESVSATSPPIPRRSINAQSPGSATKEWTHSQRERTLSKPISSTPSDEQKKIPRRISTSKPVLPHTQVPDASTIVRPIIPPIRAFRTSGSRKGIQGDMNNASFKSYDDGDDPRQDSQHRDRSLRALEGRQSNEWSRDTVPVDGDDETTETDLFMKIAREESSSVVPRRKSNARADEQNGESSQLVRAARQRPYSTAYTTSFPGVSSPRQASRRLSDQETTSSRARRTANEQPEQQLSRDVSHQSRTSIKPSLRLNAGVARSTASSLKPSPITPRTQSVLDNSADRSSIFARRPSTNEHSRSSSVRHPTGLSKSFNASPLVTKTTEQQPVAAGHHDASESSNSTAAPSTVWDELDELKSRIHRLELTGKMPKTSVAAMSRASDERPPTSGTGATTLSGSPKRASNGGAQTEIISTASSHRNTKQQPIIDSALEKVKPHIGSEVYDAIRTIASDASALSQMMGPVGQPGPISSGASTIGTGGPGTVTDRQLRKKADSICRGVVELCLALREDVNDRQRNLSSSRPQTRGASMPRGEDPPSSPPPIKVFTGAQQQRQMAGADEPLPSVEGLSSPRATRFDKRAMFNFTGMNGAANTQSPRYAQTGGFGGGDDSTVGRRSSLMIARSRRGVTEEPEDQGRKTSLLRTRRAGTEESDDGQKTPFALPQRRVATIGRVSNIEEEPIVAARAPSRAFTDISRGLRIAVPNRNDMSQRSEVQEPASAAAAPPRRRLLTSNLPTPGLYSSRLATPTTPGGRRYLQVDRPRQEDAGDTGMVPDRYSDERGQRYSMSGSTTSQINRASTSLHRKRHSGIPSMSGTASNVGGYR